MRWSMCSLLVYLSCIFPYSFMSTTLDKYILSSYRRDNNCGFLDCARFGLRGPSVRRLRPPRPPLLPDSAYGAHGSTGWYLETPRLGGLRSQAGAHHHSLHRIPRTYICIIPCLLGGKRRERRTLFEFCGRSVVGGGKYRSLVLLQICIYLSAAVPISVQ